ncbi:MAG: exonuclease subunit SbcD [Chitinophagales bacterium]
MRILHTADWHLGKRLENFSRLNEQEEVLEEICNIAEQQAVDVVLIAGDLFDTFNPSTEAVELFYKTVKRLANNGSRAVVAIAGNHDSPERIEAPDPLARECGIIFAGFPNSIVKPFSIKNGIEVTKSDTGFLELKLPLSDFPLRLLLTPYASELRLKSFFGTDDTEVALRKLLQQHWQQLAATYCDEEGVNMLVAHLYLMKKDAPAPEEPDDEKPILHLGGAQAIYSENIPSHLQYVALGHLHRKQVIDISPCPVIYSSSPLAYSFSEANQQKYVMLIDASPAASVKIQEIPLKKGKRLLRFRSEKISDAIDWLKEHRDALVEITMVMENFLTAEERKQLYAVHPFIINIIPEVKNGMSENKVTANPDITKNINELFNDYFKHRTGQQPNENILNLFKELLAADERV